MTVHSIEHLVDSIEIWVQIYHLILWVIYNLNASKQKKNGPKEELHWYAPNLYDFLFIFVILN